MYKWQKFYRPFNVSDSKFKYNIMSLVFQASESNLYYKIIVMTK
jgi:hypothetical protein